MALAWPVAVVQKYSSEDIELLEQQYKNCNTIRGLLSEVLTNEIERVRMSLESEGSLEKPNLEHRRDRAYGHIAGLRVALNLLTLTEGKTDARRDFSGRAPDRESGQR